MTLPKKIPFNLRANDAADIRDLLGEYYEILLLAQVPRTRSNRVKNLQVLLHAAIAESKKK